MEIIVYNRDLAEPVARLEAQLGYEVDPEAFHRRIEALRQRGDFTLLVALDQGVPLGFVAFEYRLTLLYDRPICHLMNLVVDQGYRGRGHGKALVDRVLDDARTRGAPLVQLTSGYRPERLAAHEFYQRYGFTKSGARFTFDLG